MLSIVLPLFYEEDNVGFIYGELIRHLGEGPPAEIIFVDDGSRDGTFDRVRELARKDPRVKGIRLSRNFGHQTALLAGLKEATGDAVVMMDADGQHPPSMIPELIGKLQEGYDIVNTVRLDTRDSRALKKVSSRWFYRIFNTLSDTKIEPASADFRIMNRKALDAFLEIGEKDRFTRGLISWMGFRQTSLPYHAEARHRGKSKYNLKRMRIFAIDGVTSFSSKPLRISTYLGFFTLLLGLCYAIYALVVYILGRTNPGWASLMITLLIIGGVQLLTVGIAGEYIARIYHETKQRPHYFIEDRTGSGDDQKQIRQPGQEPVR